MPKKPIIKATFGEEFVITEDSDEARELYNQSRFGELKKGKVQLSLLEAYYLFEKDRLEIKSEAGRKLSEDTFLRKAKKQQANFLTKYSVLKDFRNRGYIIKTALKFGADFRVYDRGIKPGEDHAKWVVFPVHESNSLTWQEWAAKNRVAHSTKKRLLIAVVDEETCVSYWEARWIRP
jgi:tRNA-intron endonuclease, archaea type